MGRTNLGFIFDFHITRSQKFRINPLRQPRKYIRPRRPNAQPQRKRAQDAKHRVPNDIPQKRIQKVQHEIHDVHDRERQRNVIATQSRAEKLVVAPLDLHPHHDLDRVPEALCEEEVRLRELAPEDEEPQQERRHPRGLLQRRVARGEGLAREVLA